MTFHNSALARLVPDGNCRAEDLARVEAALSDHHTLTFVRLPSGLYSASSAGESIAATGYANVWVRDNIYVAFAHHVTGARHIATEVVEALIGFFTRYCHRFDDIISGAVDPQDVANRPHVRFDGRTLREIGDQRASAWRRYCSARYVRASCGFDDGDRGVISSKSARDPTLMIMSNPIAIFFDLGDNLVIPHFGAASPRRQVEHTGDRGVRRLSGLVPSASPLLRVAADPMSSRTSKGVSDV